MRNFSRLIIRSGLNIMNDEEIIQHLSKLLDHTIYLGKTIFPDTSKKPNDLYLICSGPLLIKALHKAHSINLLTSEDLLEEAEIILRVLIEISFVIGAIEKNPEFLEKYGKSAYSQKFRAIKNVKKASEQNIPNLKVSDEFIRILEDDIEFLKKKIKKEKLKEIKIVDYAKEAGLLSIYYSSYSQLCSSVHSGPEDLEPYFSKTDNGTTLKNFSPQKNNKELILFSAAEAMFRILNSLSKIFSVKSKKLQEAEEVFYGFNSIIWNKCDPNKSLQRSAKNRAR